jgi:potassium/hydrogen antiporter
LEAVILAIGLFVFAAFFFKAVFDRTGVPDVLLLMLCGVILGPVLGWVTPQQFGAAGGALSAMALVVILFESGVDLDLSALKPSLAATLTLSLVTFVVTGAICTFAGILFAGLSVSAALMLGAILAGTSSAVVIPLVQSLRMSPTPRTVLILESALTDVLCIVGLFMLIESATKGATTFGHVAWVLIETLTFAAGIGILAGGAWLMVLRRARRLRHGSYASVGMCFILYGLAEMAGFSGAITAISFGVVLASGRRFAAATGWLRPGRLAAFSSREHGFLKEIIFVLKTFFFVYLGISMRLDNVPLLILGAGIVIAVFACRHLIAGLFCDKSATNADVALTAAMVPKGLAAAVLAGLPLQYGVAGGETIQALAYAVVLFSILLTALLVALQRVAGVQRLYALAYRRGLTAAPPSISPPH